MRNNDYENMSAAEIYKTFVGNQSTKEFMELSPDMTVREAVADYRKNCEYFKELTKDEADIVESRIEDYICDNLGIEPNSKF